VKAETNDVITVILFLCFLSNVSFFSSGSATERLTLLEISYVWVQFKNCN